VHETQHLLKIDTEASFDSCKRLVLVPVLIRQEASSKSGSFLPLTNLWLEAVSGDS
jgi:hypothetical protein